MKVTNTSEAPQGVHTLGGVAYILPGESKELDLNQDLADLAAALDFLTVEGKPIKGEAKRADIPSIDIPDNEVDQLRQQLESSTADVVRLTALVADRDTEIADLKKAAENDTSAAEITKLTTAVADKDTEITSLQATIVDLQAQVERLNASTANTGQQQSTEQNQQPVVVPVGPFEVKETNPGWFGIFGADGNQVGKSIRAADGDTFKAMTPEEQLAYLTAPAPAPAAQ